MTAWRRAPKYHAHKTEISGRTFDSRKEASRWQELCLLEKAGQISGLRCQVRFELIPEQREPDKTGPRGGIIRGKVLEKPCSYIADFVYQEDGHTVVEDCKGFRTPEYRIKKKLMLWVHGIKIRET